MAAIICPSLSFSSFTVWYPTNQAKETTVSDQTNRPAGRKTTRSTYRGRKQLLHDDDDVAPDPPLRRSGTAPDPPLGCRSTSMPLSPRSSASTCTSTPPWSRSSSPAQKIGICLPPGCEWRRGGGEVAVEEGEAGELRGDGEAGEQRGGRRATGRGGRPASDGEAG